MSQLDNQLGVADETVYGTRVVPTLFVDFLSESLARQQTNRVSAGLRKGQKVQRADHQSQANKGASGGLQQDLQGEGVAKFLKHLFGKAPVIAGAAPANTMTYTLGDGVGLSMSLQVGRPGVGGAVKAFDYSGVKVVSGTISQGIDAYALLDLNLDAQNEVDTQTLVAAPVYPTTQHPFHDGLLSVTVNGTPFFSKSSSVTVDRQLAVDRFGQRASTLKKEPIPNGLAAVSGSLMGEFEDTTTYDLFVAGTIVPIVLDWVGPVLGAANWEFKVTLPACRLDGPKPVTKGPGILDADTPFTVLYDGSTEPITAVLTTSDTTA